MKGDENQWKEEVRKIPKIQQKTKMVVSCWRWGKKLKERNQNSSWIADSMTQHRFSSPLLFYPLYSSLSPINHQNFLSSPSSPSWVKYPSTSNPIRNKQLKFAKISKIIASNHVVPIIPPGDHEELIPVLSWRFQRSL